MSGIPYYRVHAFTGDGLRGNPAGVCVLDEWLQDEALQSIAAEVNLSETAFIRLGDSVVPLRWFSPTEEVPLCGHATLAAGTVLLERLGSGLSEVVFSTASGDLIVSRAERGYLLNLPAVALTRVKPPPPGLDHALGCAAVEFWRSDDDPNL